MNRKLTVLAILMFVCLGPVSALGQETEYRPGGPQFAKVWIQFYAEPGHEPELDDPLIAAGKKMTTTICEAIMHKDMKRRRYAIGALGFIGDKRAIPTLEAILKSENELDYFRGDALKAIYQIDKKLGTTYAKQFKTNNYYLSDISQAILKKEPWLTEATDEK